MTMKEKQQRDQTLETQRGFHKSSSSTVVKSFVMVGAQGSRTMRRVLNKDEVIVYEFPVPKKENSDVNQVRLLRCFSWFSWPVCSPPGFLFLCGCCSESEDSVI